MKISLLQSVLGTVSSRCAKKTVGSMTELVAALLMVHGSLSSGSRNVKVYNLMFLVVSKEFSSVQVRSTK